MLFDVVEKYSETVVDSLTTTRQDIITELSHHHDHKKILSFLNKSALVGIDDKKQHMHIGLPNEFVLVQVKKFFHKALTKAIQEVYNPKFKPQYHIYPALQTPGNHLVVDLKKLLKVETKKIATNQHESNSDNKTSHFAKKFDVVIDYKYSFDSFVVGSHNTFAYNAAKAVADNPGEVYNPLFLYGSVGLGKTHLMYAIGNHIMQSYPEKTVLYLPTTKLIDEIIMAIRKNKLSSLMKMFDEIDVLLLDDVQFLADKDKTQEIFHNIFNDFHMKKKQVIMSSDRPPKELHNIEARLKSRFALGLVTDINTPDYETRIAILQAKLAQRSESLDFELLGILAKYITDNVRELEGALNIIMTKKQLTGIELGEDDMYDCLKTLWYDVETKMDDVSYTQVASINTTGISRYSKIVEFVATYYNLSVQDLKSDSRRKEISQARQMLMVIAKKKFDRTLEKIGDYFGGKNHATVIYALRHFDKKLKKDDNIRHDYNVVMEHIER